jgi:hypothetical protein
LFILKYNANQDALVEQKEGTLEYEEEEQEHHFYQHLKKEKI